VEPVTQQRTPSLSALPLETLHRLFPPAAPTPCPHWQWPITAQTVHTHNPYLPVTPSHSLSNQHTAPRSKGLPCRLTASPKHSDVQLLYKCCQWMQPSQTSFASNTYHKPQRQREGLAVQWCTLQRLSHRSGSHRSAACTRLRTLKIFESTVQKTNNMLYASDDAGRPCSQHQHHLQQKRGHHFATSACHVIKLGAPAHCATKHTCPNPKRHQRTLQHKLRCCDPTTAKQDTTMPSSCTARSNLRLHNDRKA
jgi:hypothetical protein